MRVHFAPQSTLYISLLDVKSGPYNNGHGLSLLTGAATLFSVVKASFILGRNSPVTYSVALAPKMYVIRETNLDEMDEQRRLFDPVGYFDNWHRWYKHRYRCSTEYSFPSS